MNSIELVNLPQGFAEATANIKHRLILSVQKRQKHGGTHFALTAPAPIAYCNFDKDSAEDVLPKFAGRKHIVAKTYWLDVNVTSASKGDIQAAATAKVDEFQRDFEQLLVSNVKTIILDTSTELYAYKRLADFGKLTQVMPHHYGPVNQWFRTLLDGVSSTDKNIILLERRKKEYINDSWSGGYDRSGFSETPFLVQVNVKLERLQVASANGVCPFELEVIDCSQNALVSGVRLQSDPSMPADWSIITGNDGVDRALMAHDQASFPWLGVAVFPDTKLADWV